MVSPHTHVHRDGGAKIDLEGIVGVGTVTDKRTGRSKLYATRRGLERLLEEIEKARTRGER
jgi:hypothetical protein